MQSLIILISASIQKEVNNLLVQHPTCYDHTYFIQSAIELLTEAFAGNPQYNWTKP
jgi:hypothetical protein